MFSSVPGQLVFLQLDFGFLRQHIRKLHLINWFIILADPRAAVLRASNYVYQSVSNAFHPGRFNFSILVF